jgi:hypothetical protein
MVHEATIEKGEARFEVPLLQLCPEPMERYVIPHVPHLSRTSLTPDEMKKMNFTLKKDK